MKKIHLTITVDADDEKSYVTATTQVGFALLSVKGIKAIDHVDLEAAIESARLEHRVNDDAARAATVCLTFKDDEALLACRLIAQGSDPASIEFIRYSEISNAVRLAHRHGPGSLTGIDKRRWLYLTSRSHDESTRSTLLGRVQQLIEAVRSMDADSNEDIDFLVKSQEEKIKRLPFRMGAIGGVTMRIYGTDLGFAAAYWSGEEFAAVQGDGYIMVASQGRPLAELGIQVTKVKSTHFGIVL